MGVFPFCVIWITGPEMSRLGTDGGNGKMTASTAPATAGVAGPHAGVKSATPFAPGVWLRSMGRRWPVPRQVPNIRTRSTFSVPSAVIPMLERSASGGWSSTPERSRIPLGRPSAHAKRSPLTPAAVESRERFDWIELTFSRPRIAPFERTGLRA
jgi:hypothetical protein